MSTAYQSLASSRIAAFSSLSVGMKSLVTEDKLYQQHIDTTSTISTYQSHKQAMLIISKLNASICSF